MKTIQILVAVVGLVASQYTWSDTSIIQRGSTRLFEAVDYYTNKANHLRFSRSGDYVVGVERGEAFIGVNGSRTLHENQSNNALYGRFMDANDNGVGVGFQRYDWGDPRNSKATITFAPSNMVHMELLAPMVLNGRSIGEQARAIDDEGNIWGRAWIDFGNRIVNVVVRWDSFYAVPVIVTGLTQSHNFEAISRNGRYLATSYMVNGTRQFKWHRFNNQKQMVQAAVINNNESGRGAWEKLVGIANDGAVILTINDRQFSTRNLMEDFHVTYRVKITSGGATQVVREMILENHVTEAGSEVVAINEHGDMVTDNCKVIKKGTNYFHDLADALAFLRIPETVYLDCDTMSRRFNSGNRVYLGARVGAEGVFSNLATKWSIGI